MELKDIILKKTYISKEEMLYLVNKTNNKKDYIFLNYLEKRLIDIKGKDFIQKSHHRIQYIMGLLLENDIDGLYNMYSESLKEYIKISKNFDSTDSFNITFSTLIHISIKILRKHSS